MRVLQITLLVSLLVTTQHASRVQDVTENLKLIAEFAMCTGESLWKVTMYMATIMECAVKYDSLSDVQKCIGRIDHSLDSGKLTKCAKNLEIIVKNNFNYDYYTS